MSGGFAVVNSISQEVLSINSYDKNTIHKHLFCVGYTLIQI